MDDAASPVVEAEATPGSTPIPSINATPVASPVAGATPVTGSESTPVVEADPNAAVLAELQATANSIFACLNERNFEMYAAFTSDAFRGRLFGSAEPLSADQFVPLAATLPDVDSRILTIGNLQTIDADTVTVDITYLSANQVNSGTWTFRHGSVDGLASWTLDREDPQPAAAPEGASTVRLTFADDAITLDPTTVSGPDVVFALSNPTGEDHEALVLRLEDGIDTSVLLRGGTGFPEGVTIVGQATVVAGADGTLVLSGLEPGTYTIVDLLLDADGLPHLSLGLEATLTVTP